MALEERVIPVSDVLVLPVVPAGAGDRLLRGLGLAEPVTSCLGCERAIPAGRTWCGWVCRNFDDRHDDCNEMDGDE
ncbi:hypothetical protein [Streptomyces jumonjinensis]|uniref:Uncharacterized protein n=1 Tax=Streptomyces jumonjinensis TaxID=1945 RepID=A0A646KME9_STRJU|nr:hypothetical protein [Streptomyces jumonjinensis]MQT03121.1 hypothetical protein [Streptomyces jumonjinensis]